MEKTKALGLFLCVAAMAICPQVKAITPNPLVSGGVKAIADGTETDYLTDGSLINWKYSTAKKIAFQLKEGPTKLRINWESLGDCAWATNFTTGCGHSGTALSDFKIFTSANSTNGVDGDWTLATEVKGNPVMARGVDIDFAGKSWFRIESEKEVGQILEVQAFDMSNDGDDTWFFMGTSISQMGIKQQDTDSTTADLIHARHPDFTPAMLRGGIGCINSTEVVAHLGEYLEYAGNVKYWAIEMGTNDAWGGGDWNVGTFEKNMQTIIDSAKAHGITPVLARIIATNPAKTDGGWQINPKFLDVIDNLTQKNGLPKGPDFYSYFEAHPELLANDGVHPNGETGGGKAMHRLWAEALAPLYATSSIPTSSSSEPETPGSSSTTEFIALTAPAAALVQLQGQNIVVSSQLPGEVTFSLVDMTGHVVANTRAYVQQGATHSFAVQAPAGSYIATVRGPGGKASINVRFK